jgi:YVTN family beta-propeller protein
MTNQSRFAPAIALAMALMFVVFASDLPHASATVAAQDVSPAALTELSIDNASSNSASLGCAFGLSDTPQTPRGQVQFSWANRLTPASYPATLRAVTIGLNRIGPTGLEVLPDQLYRVAIYLDPESDGPANGQAPAATFLARARGREKVLTFNLAVPLTITGGSFVVAVIDEFKIAAFPAVYDTPGKSSPPGSASYISQDAGQHWTRVADLAFSGQGQCNQPGSFFIRATVETGAVAAFNITKVKDPAAVEPWDVSIGNSFALVTNYVSDNLTVIAQPNNMVTNVALGDGPGGTADGPFGVVGPILIGQGSAAAIKAYVTLFGSNTIPTKGSPIDYATVGQGRVVVLTQGPGNSFTPAVTINVGKGPRYPAIVTAAGKTKLYVPCGGANRVDVIDTATNAKIAEIPVGLDPSSCTPSLGGAKLYVTNFGDGTISVIDPKTDRKIKDIAAPSVPVPQPFGSTPASVNVVLVNPWRGAVSATNGNLYVTYWGAAGNVFPNGAIAEFDTCNDTFLRATLDEQTRGTASGGPFGIAASGTTNHPMAFTNDGAGIVGLLDTRIDQVVSVPIDGLNMCAKPRGVAVGVDSGGSGTLPPIPNRMAVVACGQPDNAVLLVTVPAVQAQTIAGLPVINSVNIGEDVRLLGSGFENGDLIEAFDPGTGACLSFNKPKKLKKGGVLFLQRGRLSDGRAPSDISGVLIRFVKQDGTVILLTPSQ